MERYKRICKQINEQINPSDEFIQNLRENLNQKVAEKENKRMHNYNFSKVAMIFCTLMLISSGVFARDIGDWFAKVFSNSDETMQIAVENGYVQNVEMDYVEHAGIGIKVNSLIIDDNKMNIIFDVKGEIDGRVYVKKLNLNTKNNEYVEQNKTLLDMAYASEFKSITKNEHIIIFKISNVEQNFYNNETLNVILNGICILNDDNTYKEINEKWECSVLLEEDNFKDNKILSTNYIIKANEYIEDYKINMTSTGTIIQIYLKENFNKYKLMNKDNVYIQTEDEQKYIFRDFAKTKDNMIEMNVPITIYDKIEKFDIIFNLENEKIIFNVEKENS